MGVLRGEVLTHIVERRPELHGDERLLSDAEREDRGVLRAWLVRRSARASSSAVSKPPLSTEFSAAAPRMGFSLASTPGYPRRLRRGRRRPPLGSVLLHFRGAGAPVVSCRGAGVLVARRLRPWRFVAIILVGGFGAFSRGVSGGRRLGGGLLA